MSVIKSLRIATRRSALALAQADYVKAALERIHPNLNITLVPLVTSGDNLLDHPLATIGGKGLFIKELEDALLSDRADIAVHSMKDVPVKCAPGLEITAICERDDPRDVFVSNHYSQIKDLPNGSQIGTASLRRQGILKHLNNTIQVSLLRGNVNSRLAKLDASQYDAIMLAAAGLHRLGMSQRIKYYFSPEESLPAIGQGALAIQCREQDRTIKKLVSVLDHYPTRICITAERTLSQALGGSCTIPLGGYATLENETLYLRGMVIALDGKKIARAELTGKEKEAELIGEKVAKKLIDNGAHEILDNLVKQ